MKRAGYLSGWGLDAQLSQPEANDNYLVVLIAAFSTEQTASRTEDAYRQTIRTVRTLSGDPSEIHRLTTAKLSKLSGVSAIWAKPLWTHWMNY